MSFPLLQMLLGICALVAAGYFVWTPQARLSPYARVALALAASILALTLLQLVPLPPFVWHRLPGRELAAQVDDILGAAPWRPLTVDFEGTVRSLIVLIPPVVVLAGCLRLPSPERMRLLWIVLGFAAINAVLGIMQFASGGAATPYPSSHLGFPVGLFVNRNHNAVLLLSAMPIVAALGAIQIARGRARLPMIAATLSVIAVFGIVVIGTTSRMALVLLPISLGASLFLLFLGQSLWRVALPSALALAALAVVILVGGGFSRSLARFSSIHDARFDYWTDVYWALGHYGLAGTGLGTFIPVYQSAESLEAVTPAILNHAHNDYIELLLEGGLPALLLLLLVVAFIGVCAIKLVRSRVGADRALVGLAAAAAIFMFLLFSLVDFPLRMPALSCVFVILCTLLLPRTHAATEREVVKIDEGAGRAAVPRRGWRATAGRIVATVMLVAATVLVIEAGMSSEAMLAGGDVQATRWAPWSTSARERAATAQLLANDGGDALANAKAALALSPISAPAIRTIGVLRIAEGDKAAGDGLMGIASTLSWRDPLTQLWAIDAAQRSHEPAKAVERAEALFRQQVFVAPALVELLHGSTDPRLIPTLVAHLASRPPWRADFFNSTPLVPPPDLPTVATIVDQLDRTRAPLTPDEWGPVARALLAAEQDQLAQQLWRRLHATSLLTNGDFTQGHTRAGLTVPQWWHAGAFAILDQPPFDRADQAVRLIANQPQILLSQQLMLEPGIYTLSFRAAAEDAPAKLTWRLSCGASDTKQSINQVVPPGRRWQNFAISLTVPQQDCAIQTLALAHARATLSQPIWLDDVTLRKEVR
ncbi:MAG TPA: O-antigen ligase family protein [Sphingomicrobium sp.]